VASVADIAVELRAVELRAIELRAIRLRARILVSMSQRKAKGNRRSMGMATHGNFGWDGW
jgi:hypothetical protein